MTHKSKPHTEHKHHERLPLLANPVSDEAHTHGENIPLQTNTPTGYMELGAAAAPPPSSGHTEPVFNQRDKAAPSELFYDLFFVGNLAAFTKKHEMNSGANLRSYVGFFSLLWFTWLQVSLYDVRFSKDSVFDRICKAVQLGLMMGFVAIGSDFNPRDGEVEGHVFSFILMASRIVLATQYLVAFLYAKHYHTARRPFLVVLITLLVSAIAFLALSFTFPPIVSEEKYQTENKIYALWYVVSGVEAGITIFASIKWRSLSFKGTHIVERMSLLTLIILGEGVIGVAGSIQSALTFSITGTVGKDISPSFAGVIAAATLVLYFMYMLYFDNLTEDHFGSIRQQIWIILHYPLHVCLVLFVEGNTQCVKWRRTWNQVHRLQEFFDSSDLWRNATTAAFYNSDPEGFDQYLDAISDDTDYFNDQVGILNNTLIWTYNQTGKSGGIDFLGSLEGYADVQGALATIGNGIPGGSQNQTALFDLGVALDQVYVGALKLVFGAMSIKLPEDLDKKTLKMDFEPTEEQLSLLQQEANGFAKIFGLVIRYFFVAGGAAMVVLGVLAFLSIPKGKRPGFRDYTRCGLFLVIGLATAIVVPIVGSTSDAYLKGPWVVPSGALLMFILVVVTHLI